jgi:hypothetical protein
MKQHAIYNRIHYQNTNSHMTSRYEEHQLSSASPERVADLLLLQSAFCSISRTLNQKGGIRPVPYRGTTNTRCHCTKFSCTDLCTPDLTISNFRAMRPAGAYISRTTRTSQDSHGGNFRHVTPSNLIGRCQRFRRNFCLNSLVLKKDAARSFETGAHPYWQYST